MGIHDSTNNDLLPLAFLTEMTRNNNISYQTQKEIDSLKDELRSQGTNTANAIREIGNSVYDASEKLSNTIIDTHRTVTISIDEYEFYKKCVTNCYAINRREEGYLRTVDSKCQELSNKLSKIDSQNEEKIKETNNKIIEINNKIENNKHICNIIRKLSIAIFIPIIFSIMAILSLPMLTYYNEDVIDD